MLFELNSIISSCWMVRNLIDLLIILLQILQTILLISTRQIRSGFSFVPLKVECHLFLYNPEISGGFYVNWRILYYFLCPI